MSTHVLNCPQAKNFSLLLHVFNRCHLILELITILHYCPFMFSRRYLSPLYLFHESLGR
jgi:hypothetical protein